MAYHINAKDCQYDIHATKKRKYLSAVEEMKNQLKKEIMEK
jgi:hypothetical protein